MTNVMRASIARKDNLRLRIRVSSTSLHLASRSVAQTACQSYSAKWLFTLSAALTKEPLQDLEIVLRIYFLQQWFNLSDPVAEEALYDSASMRRFAGIDLGQAPVPERPEQR